MTVKIIYNYSIYIYNIIKYIIILLKTYKTIK